MQNPMLASLNRNQASQMISQIKQTMNNPMLLMPQYRQMADYVKANGGNAEELFYKKASEMGVDPNDILKAMRNA